MSNYKLNHSRYIDNGAKDIAEELYKDARTRPTVKQVNFFKKLQQMCRENDIDSTVTWKMQTRQDYAVAIDRMIYVLQKAGFDMHGNGKSATYSAKIYEDYRRRLCINERISIEDGTPKRKRPKIENIFIKQEES